LEEITLLIIEGISVYSGVAVGPLRFFKRASITITKKTANTPETEIANFEDARETAKQQLNDLYIKATKDAGKDIAALFEVHIMMLDDPDFYEPVIAMIKDQKTSAEYALNEVSIELSELFSSMDDAYMKERAADILDISKRVQIALAPEKYQSFILDTPSIIAADDLAPSETIQLDKKMILGFAMREGSLNSHTSILARSMGIPAIIGTGTKLCEQQDNKPAILDSTTGKLYIEPDKETIKTMNQKADEIKKKREKLEALKGLPNITLDGREIDIFANVLNLFGIEDALANDAGGIGLMRSEFLYLESTDYPTEEEQFEVYKKAAEQMGGKKVTIRTLDIGADKQASYFN
jgi:phosphotransferase system enzyme I (PtsI)